MLFNSISGKEGNITLPALGNAVVGIIRSWHFKREESGPSAGAASLRASLSYVNPMLLLDDTARKEIVLDFIRDPETGKTRHLKVTYTKLTLEDHELRVTGAELSSVEG